MEVPKKVVDIKELGEMQFKLKDIYKTIAFIIGIISMGFGFNEMRKTDNYRLTEHFSQDVHTIKTSIIAIDTYNKLVQDRDIKDLDDKLGDTNRKLEDLIIKLNKND